MEKCENIAKILIFGVTATTGQNGIKAPSHRPQETL